MFVAAQARGQALATLDLGFADIWPYSPESHHDIFLLRLQDQGPANVMAVLEPLAGNDDLDAFIGCVTESCSSRTPATTVPSRRSSQRELLVYR